MIQKKVCMVGVHGTGKTSLVQRFVHSIFSPRYLSTVGVKIDKKEVAVGAETVNLMLWDLEGRDGSRDVSPSYVKGANGVIYVVDGTRRDSLEQVNDIRDLVEREVGVLPSVLAFNKKDLKADWQVTAGDQAAAGQRGWHVVETSAKSGEGVEGLFTWIATAMMRAEA